jgi:hypothetical protein
MSIFVFLYFFEVLRHFPRYSDIFRQCHQEVTLWTLADTFPETIFTALLTSINASSVKTLIAIGDSSIIINLPNNLKTLLDSKLAHLIARIKKEVLWFEDTKFFHVLRDLNLQADNLTNKASTLSEGILR